MKVTKGDLVVIKGEKTFKNLYKLISENIRGRMPGGEKGKEVPLVRTPQRKDNHRYKKVRFVENVINVVVKPSTRMVVETSVSEKFKHCLNSIKNMPC